MSKSVHAMLSMVLASLSCVVLAVASAFTAAPAMADSDPRVVIVPPTTVPDANKIPGFSDFARYRYIEPFYPSFNAQCSFQAQNCPAVDYPAQFWPFLGLVKWNNSVADGVENLTPVFEGQLHQGDEPVALFGYSQGSRVASIFMQDSISSMPESVKERISITLVGNISRPNGGAWSRFTSWGTVPILDVTFGDPTPTDLFADCSETKECKTTDISFHHDGVSDFPNYLFNPLAVLNAIVAFIHWPHPTYLAPISPVDGEPGGYSNDPDAPAELQFANQLDENLHPENFAYYGDTRYITIPLAPGAPLPIVRFILDKTPTTWAPVVEPIMELIQPVLKWRIDQAFDRSINPGKPTPIRLFRIPFLDYNPVQEAVDFVAAVHQGIADATDSVPIRTGKAATQAATASAAANADASEDPASTPRSAIEPVATTSDGDADGTEPTNPAAGDDDEHVTSTSAAVDTDQTGTTANSPTTDPAITPLTELEATPTVEPVTSGDASDESEDGGVSGDGEESEPTALTDVGDAPEGAAATSAIADSGSTTATSTTDSDSTSSTTGTDSTAEASAGPSSQNDGSPSNTNSDNDNP